ncbi:MAG: hypothetical protein WCR54_05260 [Clostridia bacterium]
MNLELLDHLNCYQNLLNDISNGHLVHAYIFISDDQEIRQALFMKMALAIYCADNNTSCHSQIINHNHVDIRYYDADTKLKIDDIEAIIEDTHILPVASNHKLYFIDNADKLDKRYQNKLLKTFEEPPKYVSIVLGVNNETSLLSTIKSRGKKLYIDGLNPADIYAELVKKGIDSDLAKLASGYSRGNYKKALDFASNENYKEIYEQTLLTFRTLKNSKQIIDHLYLNIFNKENISLTLDFLELFLSDILKISTKSNLPKYTLIDDKILEELAKEYSATSAYMAIEAINNGRAKLNSNISLISVTEKILFDILEAKYKWQ